MLICFDERLITARTLVSNLIMSQIQKSVTKKLARLHRLDVFAMFDRAQIDKKFPGSFQLGGPKQRWIS